MSNTEVLTFFLKTALHCLSHLGIGTAYFQLLNEKNEQKKKKKKPVSHVIFFPSLSFLII